LYENESHYGNMVTVKFYSQPQIIKGLK